jgi:lysophospholipid acyltransferase (LPLAT)-like uncharacterized protein
MLKRITREIETSIAAFLLAMWYYVVRGTNRLRRDPGFYEPFDQHGPVIIALWHGEHFLAPFMPRRQDKLSILVTMHRDGEILARGGRWFGLEFIRGSGDHGRDFMRKQAVQAFARMMRALRAGRHVILTADVPKVARVTGLGIVTLAKHSGRPIVPMAMASSRRYRLSNWDKTCINLPFGRLMYARAEPIFVPPDADEAALEQARQAVQASLEAVTERAYAAVDR